jgi:hypothetical protein
LTNSNLLSSAKLIDTGLAIGGFALIFDAGLLIFPIAYIFGDILTEVYGYARARRVIWAGFCALLLTAFFIWLAGILPGESSWEDSVGQAAYDAVLGGVSGLAIASLTAYWMGSFANSYVLAQMKMLTEGRWLWSRTIGSTLIGQGVDTVVFFLIATAVGVFPASLLVSLIVTNYLLKILTEAVLTPVTLLVVAALKQREQEDFYDYDTRFNPFRLDA